MSHFSGCSESLLCELFCNFPASDLWELFYFKEKKIAPVGNGKLCSGKLCNGKLINNGKVGNGEVITFILNNHDNDNHQTIKEITSKML